MITLRPDVQAPGSHGIENFRASDAARFAPSETIGLNVMVGAAVGRPVARVPATRKVSRERNQRFRAIAPPITIEEPNYLAIA